MTPADIIAIAGPAWGRPFATRVGFPASPSTAPAVVAVAAALGADYLDQEGYGRLPVDNRLTEALDAHPAWSESPPVFPETCCSCASAASRSIWQFTPAQPSFMRGKRSAGFANTALMPAGCPASSRPIASGVA